ncbi:MAG: peptidylprolyl isomerase [Clostridiales bacterium]|nr:peptidylprolyl isomerase [Clostridiales bacterium]
MAKNEKSKAEIYREERKARLASAAKKSAKKRTKHKGAGKVIGIICLVILCVAVVGGACYGILNSTGLIDRNITALSVGKYKISATEYRYMYYQQYNQLVNQSYQAYNQYGYNIYGFDYNSSPKGQESSYKDDDGNALSWDEELTVMTTDYFKQFYSLYDNAMKENYKVTEDEQKEIDNEILQMRNTASGANSSSQNAMSMSLNSYLKYTYGKGVNESFLRDLMAKQHIVQRYSEDKQQSFEDKYTDEVLDKEYAKDKDQYDVVDLRTYTFDLETLTAKEGESEKALKARQTKADEKVKASADALLKAVKDEKSFIAEAKKVHAKAEAEEKKDDTAAETAETETKEEADTTAAEDTDTAAAEDADTAAADKDDYDADTETKKYYQTKENVTSLLGEDGAKWAFDDSRKAGNSKVFKTDSAYIVVYLAKTQYPLPTADVRHILFTTKNTDTGEELSSDEIKEKKSKADSIYEEWKKGDKTEDSFATLAESNTEDTGSASNGGLYENVTPGQMVAEFNDWVFDKNRKPGDNAMIESDYGYHIMYYVGNETLNYRVTLRQNHTQDDYSSWLDKQIALDEFKLIKHDKAIKIAYNEVYELIDEYVKRIQSSNTAA